MMKKNEPKDATSSSSLIIEIIKVTPQYLWAATIIILVFLLKEPFLDLINKGKIQEINVFYFSVKLAGVTDKGGNDKIGQENLSRLSLRGAKLAKAANGKRILWVDDKHPVQNLRE
jgi:hypothetical protein